MYHIAFLAKSERGNSTLSALKKNLSQDKLSKLVNMSHNTIIKIESGLIKNPKIETVQNIAGAFGVSLDELTK